MKNYKKCESRKGENDYTRVLRRGEKTKARIGSIKIRKIKERKKNQNIH